jgi:glycerophosphoryl diester phosphodiesterase
MTSRARLLLAAVVAASALLVTLAWDHIRLATEPLHDREGPPMLIVAHRGNMAALPEDSAAAIWDAARTGADGIEFDVHQSRDRTWWVIHDATVDRTTGGSGAVHELGDDALRALRIDAGPGFRVGEHDGMGLATLTEVLDGLADFDGHLYVDLQHAVMADAADLTRQLAGRHATIICRNVQDARTVKETDASIGTLIRVDRTGAAESANIDALLLEAFKEVDKGVVSRLDHPVVTYVDEKYGFEDEEPLLRRAWAVGVDTFFTKRLASALVLRDELRVELQGAQ